MIRTFTLAASVMVLAAISGQAIAGTATPKARLDSKTSVSRQATSAFASTPSETAAHRYHGGPKSND